MKENIILTIELKHTEVRTIIAGAWQKQPDANFHLGDLKPGEMIPIVAPNQNWRERSFFIEWGYPKEESEQCISSIRMDQASDNVMFLDGYRQRRCLIPVSRCYIHERQNTYVMYPVEGEYMYLGAIYRRLNDKPYMILLTHPAYDELKNTFSYIPVVIPRELAAKWTYPGQRIKSLLKYLNVPVSYQLVEETSQNCSV